MSTITINVQIRLQSILPPAEMLKKVQDGLNTLCFNLEKELPTKDRYISYKLDDTYSEL